MTASARSSGGSDGAGEHLLALAATHGQELQRRHLVREALRTRERGVARGLAPLLGAHAHDEHRLVGVELAQRGAQPGVEAQLLREDVARAAERGVERRRLRPSFTNGCASAASSVPGSPLRIASASGSRPMPRATVARPAVTGR